MKYQQILIQKCPLLAVKELYVRFQVKILKEKAKTQD